MVWIFIFFASFCETLWASSLKFLDFHKIRRSLRYSGFISREFGLAFLPLTTYIIFGILNMLLLTMALKRISLAVCYAVWIGFGLILQTMMDMLIFKERITMKQIGFIFLLLLGIIGLQMDLGW